MSLRELILSAKDCPVASVFVHEWDCEVHVKSWTAGERAAFLGYVDSVKAQPGQSHDYLVKTFALSVCDQDGNRLFSDDDLERLNGRNGQAIQSVVEKALDHNAVRAKAVDEKKAN